MKKTKAYTKHIISLLFFGSNGLIASTIALNSYEIVLMRTLIGSIFLVLLFQITGKKFHFWKHKKDLCCIILSGIAMGTSWMFLYEAYHQIGVSITSLLYACGPVLVMILSPLIFREKLTWQKIVGFLVVVLGLALLNGTVVEKDGYFLGILYGILSAVMYFFMVLFNKKSKNITGLENVSLQLMVSFMVVATFVVIRQGAWIDFSSVNGWAVLWLGLVNTGIGCYWYFSSLSDLPVQSVAVLAYIEPLCAVIFSVLLLPGESMSVVQMIGAGCIIGGAMFGELVKEIFPKGNEGKQR